MRQIYTVHGTQIQASRRQCATKCDQFVHNTLARQALTHKCLQNGELAPDQNERRGVNAFSMMSRSINADCYWHRFSFWLYCFFCLNEFSDFALTPHCFFFLLFFSHCSTVNDLNDMDADECDETMGSEDMDDDTDSKKGGSRGTSRGSSHDGKATGGSSSKPRRLVSHCSRRIMRICQSSIHVLMTLWGGIRSFLRTEKAEHGRHSHTSSWCRWRTSSKPHAIFPSANASIWRSV